LSDAARRLPTNAKTLTSATVPFPSLIGLHPRMTQPDCSPFYSGHVKVQM